MQLRLEREEVIEVITHKLKMLGVRHGRITAESSFEDLGGDSIKPSLLAVVAEWFVVEISDEDAATILRISDIVKHIDNVREEKSKAATKCVVQVAQPA